MHFICTRRWQISAFYLYKEGADKCISSVQGGGQIYAFHLYKEGADKCISYVQGGSRSAFHLYKEGADKCISSVQGGGQIYAFHLYIAMLCILHSLRPSNTLQ